MSTNPVFDEVQALYPDVHIPDLLVEMRSWGGERIRHVVQAPPIRDLDDLVAEAKELLKNRPLPTAKVVVPDPEPLLFMQGVFPQHTVRNPGPAVVSIEDRRKLRSPKHGR